MKCIIPGPNIKVLGRAIHSLAKLGEDLYVESTENELFFRTVNTSKTAYASYSFSSVFFSYFNFESNRKNGPVSCQVSMRSALSVFRSPLTLDKTTESVQIQFQSKSDKIIFTVKYKKGVTKTFNVPVIECEALQAYYHKDSSPNSVTIQPKIVGEILSNFQNNQDEITWKVTSTYMIIKNYTEPEDDCKGIRTEICVDMDEFDNYKIQNETEITFCLKELRAVLLFSDSVCLPLTANFNTCSKPIVFIIKNDIFEVNIVVSTLSGSDTYTSQNLHPTNTIKDTRVDGDLEADDNRLEADDNHLEENDNPIEDNDNPFEDNDIPPDEIVVDNTMLRAGREKLKQVFQRCFSKEEYNVNQIPGFDVILASDSDSETEV